MSKQSHFYRHFLKLKSQRAQKKTPSKNVELFLLSLSVKIYMFHLCHIRCVLCVISFLFASQHRNPVQDSRTRNDKKKYCRTNEVGKNEEYDESFCNHIIKTIFFVHSPLIFSRLNRFVFHHTFYY